MNFRERIKKIERAIEMNENLFPKMPDLTKWSNEELDQYIISETNKFHIENGIKNFEDAEKIYKSYLERELISKEEFDIFIGGEKEFWKRAGQSDSAVFFV